MAQDKREMAAAERIHASIGTYKRVFRDSQDGYEILIDLMRQFNMLQPSFSGENPYDMAFKEGGRNVILFILKKTKMKMQDLEQLIEGEDRV